METAPTEPYATGTVISKDGTRIGYRKLGEGPGVVVLHGSMSSARNHFQLAQGLADAFTVYIPDRRGRGLSGQYTSEDALAREAEDLKALLDHTGAARVFGVSVGGLIGLQAALSPPAIEKLALYEPPLFSDTSEPTAFLRQFDAELDEGNVAGALATAMQRAHLAPDAVDKMPRRMLEFMTKMMLRREDENGADPYISLRELAPTLHYDGRLIVASSGPHQRFAGIAADVLLLGGSRSSQFLKDALGRLERTLPNARRVEFAGLDHSGSWNSDRGGNPQPVAAKLRRFLGGTATPELA